jgi:MFS family permease
MTLYTRAFWTACAVHFTGAMSLSLYVLMPLFVRTVGGSEAVVGLALGTGAVASVVTRPYVGALLDRLGVRPVLIGAGLLNLASWFPFLAVTSVGPWLFVWLVVHSVAWGTLFAAYFTYAADLAPPARRAEGIAVFGVFGIAGNGLAPVLGEQVIATTGFPTFFLTAAGFAALSVAITLGVRPVRHVAHATAPGLRAAFGVAAAPGLPRVLATTTTLGVAINAAWYFVAPYTRDVGIARTAPFFLAYSATSVLIRLFGRRSLDGWAPHRVSTPAFVVFGLGLLSLVLLPAPGVLIVSGVACGIGHGTLFPVLSALSVARAPVGRQGGVMSLHTAALDLGAVVGTPICGAVADAYGWRPMFALMATACLVGVALMVRDARGRPTSPLAPPGAPR